MEALVDNPLVSGLFLFFGCILLFLEVFIPSGGILGIAAFFSAGFGIYGFFSQGRPFLAVTSVVGFLGYGGLILYFIMKRVSFKGVLSPETSTSVDPRIDESLVGQSGSTVTALRPAGVAKINDRKVDVVSSGAFIDKDVPVRVVDISGNRVVVREFKEGS